MIRHRILVASLLSLLIGGELSLAQGILLPTDDQLPPMTILHQRVVATIRDQAAQTRLEQVFKNPTSQQLEATYLFPLPKGASVREFALWIDGKKQPAELIEADRARQIYTDIVRRLRDPGLLERFDDHLVRVRVFPIPAQGTQKIELTYTQILDREGGLVEYLFPMRTGTKPAVTEEDFTIKVDIESGSPIKNVYCPTHAVGITREGGNKAIVGFEQKSYSLDRDFQLLWETEPSPHPIGVTTLSFRENPTDDGYLVMLLSPNVELTADKRVPRDIVFVVDSSGSMAGDKMNQVKGALEHCIGRLGAEDRFGIVRFATTTEPFDRQLAPPTDERRRAAIDWIRKIEATGGTAISEALEAAFAMKTADARNFTVVFLTDGLPTLGTTDPAAILHAAEEKSNGSTRIFTLGVGDDVNAPLLDQLAEKSRAASVYIRPAENIELKVSRFFDKISHPVLADLKLAVVGDGVKLREMYPPKLPDLFVGGQIVVVARYTGTGPATLQIGGTLATEPLTFETPLSLPESETSRDFVPFLWAQRKVGYLLDQVRLSGENKELIDEIVLIAKKFGIVTPYTSYLVTPDEMPPVVTHPPARPPITPIPLPSPRADAGDARMFALEIMTRNTEEASKVRQQAALGGGGARRELREAEGFIAADNAQVLDELKNAPQMQSAVVLTKRVAGRNFQNVRGVWMDEGYRENGKTVRVKYLSPAYFQVLEANRLARQILAQGERVVWRTPTGQNLVIDGEGAETLSEAEIKDLLGG